jgi:hypothetical protein
MPPPIPPSLPPIVAAGPSGSALPKPRARRRWVTWLLAFLIFGAGIVVGGGGAVAIALHRLRLAMVDPSHLPETVGTHISTALDLSPEQRLEVHEIVLRHLENLRHDRAAEIAGIDRDIQAVLTPRQRIRWYRMYSDFSRHWLAPNPSGDARVINAPQTSPTN